MKKTDITCGSFCRWLDPWQDVVWNDNFKSEISRIEKNNRFLILEKLTDERLSREARAVKIIIFGTNIIGWLFLWEPIDVEIKRFEIFMPMEIYSKSYPIPAETVVVGNIYTWDYRNDNWKTFTGTLENWFHTDRNVLKGSQFLVLRILSHQKENVQKAVEVLFLASQEIFCICSDVDGFFPMKRIYF